MRELTREEKITKVYGYESDDGRIFDSKEECEKYEKSAEYVISEDFNKLIIDKPFAECNIWEDYGCGSEEFMMAVIDIKDVNALEIANRYMKMRQNDLIGPEYIGKRVLVNLGNYYEEKSFCNANPKTMDELVKRFIKNVEGFFGEEYTLDAPVKSMIKYRLKNAIDFYKQGSYTEEDLFRTIHEVYEMLD